MNHMDMQVQPLASATTSRALPGWWMVAAILMPTLIMLPILIWPHYGLFSDAGQAIAYPKIVIDNWPHSLLTFRPLEDGRWNPLFHGLTVLIYFLAGESARALLVVQWLMFVISSVTLTWIVTVATGGNRRLALFGSALFCTASSVFENFYTLDKVEPRVTVFAALAITFFLMRYLAADNTGARSRMGASFMVGQFCLGVLVVFSKETGVYLGAAGVLTWLAFLLNKGWGRSARSVVACFAAVQVSVILGFVALFKVLSLHMTYRYVSYEVTVHLVLHNALYYLARSPELALGVGCAVYWCLRAVWRRLPGPTGAIEGILVFTSLALLIYFSGICLWRWPLDYYLLPAHYLSALIVPLSLFSLNINAAKWRLLSRILMVLGGTVWALFVGYRVWLGIAIYAQDAGKDDLARYLSRPEYLGKRLVLPLPHPDNAEVGERLKFFINRNRPHSQEVDLFNFWEPPYANRDNLARFKAAAGIAPDEKQLAEIATHPERHVLWQFGGRGNYDMNVKYIDDPAAWNPQLLWRASYLRHGDLIVVPTGSPTLKWAGPRGIGMYAQTTDDFLRRTPLELKHRGGVHRGLGNTQLGWDVFEVGSEGNTDAKGSANSKYSVPALLSFNANDDITERNTGTTLTLRHKYPEQGVLLGYGWFEVEEAGGTRFRWMGKGSELVLTNLPSGNCSMSIDVEPLLLSGSEPFVLSIKTAKDAASYALASRSTVTFDFKSTGQTVQVVELNTKGGVSSPPKNDPRLLKMRAFSAKLKYCRPTEKQH